jgi:hypothetical protein
MKKAEKEKQGLKSGLMRKCQVCKKVEPLNKWLLDPNSQIYACINCGVSFYDTDMLKLIIIRNNFDTNYTFSNFSDALEHFRTVAESLKIKTDQKIENFFKIQYNSNKIFVKDVCLDDVDFEWPFIIEKITLKCFGFNKAIIVINPENGFEYALNGAAKDEYLSIEPIWREKDGKKIPLSDIIAYIANDYKT